MVNSVLVGVRWMRMVAARAHWHTVLRDVKMRVVCRAGAWWARTVDSVSCCTS